MDTLRKKLDKIGARRRRELLSEQVSGARYFFLQLAPGRGVGCRPALGGRERCNSDYRIERASYGYHGLEYVAEGRGSVTLDGATHEIAAGTVFAYGLKTRCGIATDAAAPMVKYFVCLAGQGSAARLARAGVAPGGVRRLAAHAEMRDLFEELIHDAQRATPVARELASARLEVLLLKLEEQMDVQARGGDPARERFLRCKMLIDENAATLSTLEEIAGIAGLDGSSVCRLFRRHHGGSPYQYLLRRKMTLAAEQLVENGGLVKEAAARVGFADAYHFSRCFKAVHGVAPRELLRHRRGG
ncbi:AraC family transcriptional regulator [Horticoccus luteus]|uniref:AraC family transcriptional regulator n=1 Tax=Horticoccus luteus TaxID=2862869 RepID=A0A8F9XIX5_9BACT|nr:AraC family transcriptional regulator [Horticoccus luteus]QYM78053.1 AraC family transcriptional regulator [Horticoccus luteus]